MTRYIAATVDEIPPGGRKRVTLGGRDIALFRVGDRYHAIQDRCPHEGASLCAGRITGLATSDRPGRYRLEREGELLRCPWHGWEFDIRTGQSWCDPERMRVRSFNADVEPGDEVIKGPFGAEVYDVRIERQYVVIDTGPIRWMDAEVAGRIELPGNVVKLELKASGGARLLRYEAGAHIDVEIAPGLVRQYSLCGAPDSSSSYHIAVLREPSSRGGSARVHSDLFPGAHVRISQPRNLFPLARPRGRSLLIGGGIGITPLIAMAYALLAEGAPFVLHYLVRSPEEAAFLAELQDGSIAPYLHVHFSRVEQPTRLVPAAVLAENPDAEVYVCGPTALIDAVAAAHAAAGQQQRTLHLEHFANEASLVGAAFVVEAARSGKRVQVPPGRSIAEMLAKAGIAVDLSCEQGVCGACLTPLIEGTADHRDAVLSPEERSAGRQIAVCCSRALSDVLVLDV